jgi:hypothetical protein
LLHTIQTSGTNSFGPLGSHINATV